MSDEKTECGYMEENAEEPCNFMLTEDERLQHMFHVHGIPSATIVHEKEPDAPLFGEDVPKSVRNAQAMMKKREEFAKNGFGAKPKEPQTQTEEVKAKLQGIGYHPCGYNGCEIMVHNRNKPAHMLEFHGITKQELATGEKETTKPLGDVHDDEPEITQISDKDALLLKPTNENRISTSGLKCPRCNSTEGFQRWGKKNGAQVWNCKKCKKKFINDTNEDREVPVKDKHLETIRKSYEKQKKKYKNVHKIAGKTQKRKYKKRVSVTSKTEDGKVTFLKKKKKRADIEVSLGKDGKINVEAPAKKLAKDEYLRALFSNSGDATFNAVLKESQQKDKVIAVLLPLVEPMKFTAALAELYDLRQEKKNGGLK